MTPTLRKLAQTLASPQAVMSRWADRYRDAVRDLTRSYLLSQRPGDVDPEAWEEGVALFVSYIEAELTPPTGKGITVYWQGRGMLQADGTLVSGGAGTDGDVEVITLQDLQAWVEAGRQGDPLGKRLEAMDAGLSTEEIALHLHGIVHGFPRADGTRHPPSTSDNHERLREAVREFLQEDRTLSFGPYFPAIRSLWEPLLRHFWNRDLRGLIQGKTS